MRSDPRDQPLLPRSTVAISVLGAVLLVAGAIVQFSAGPRVQPGTAWQVLMGAGAACELVASFRIWRWLKRLRAGTGAERSVGTDPRR